MPKPVVSVLRFLSLLLWLDGKPLVLEPYRRRLFERAFSLDETGQLRYSLVLDGRAKKNNKSLDEVLAAIYSLVVRTSMQGSDGVLVANDLDQALNNHDLASKIIKINPSLDRVLRIKSREIERRDGRGVLTILPARDVSGAHGKSAAFIGYDEIHPYRDYALFEALSPDPTRRVLTWICSYDGLFHSPGRPLWDLLQRGKAGSDPRMLLSWYSGDFCTDPDFAQLPPLERANPSMASWTNPRYLEEQRLRLPSHKFRRLHLNIGGQPEGAFLNAERIAACTVTGRTVLPPNGEDCADLVAFVDMSGGSADDAVLAIAKRQADGTLVLVLVMDQGQPAPFDPRRAVRRFAAILRTYGIHRVRGDAYAGQTFRMDFESEGIGYEVTSASASSLYERLEPRLNTGAVELLDVPKLTEQLLGLVQKGAKVGHTSGEHDDFANACAGALALAAGYEEVEIDPTALQAANAALRVMTTGADDDGVRWSDDVGHVGPEIVESTSAAGDRGSYWRS